MEKENIYNDADRLMTELTSVIAFLIASIQRSIEEGKLVDRIIFNKNSPLEVSVSEYSFAAETLAKIHESIRLAFEEEENVKNE